MRTERAGSRERPQGRARTAAERLRSNASKCHSCAQRRRKNVADQDCCRKLGHRLRKSYAAAFLRKESAACCSLSYTSKTVTSFVTWSKSPTLRVRLASLMDTP